MICNLPSRECYDFFIFVTKLKMKAENQKLLRHRERPKSEEEPGSDYAPRLFFFLQQKRKIIKKKGPGGRKRK